MDAFFQPKSIALIGASPKPMSIGQQLTTNLLNHDGSRQVFLVNPNYKTINGERVFRNIASIDQAIDLVVLAISSRKIPEILEECAQVGIKGALIIAAGFRETGLKGVSIEQEIIQISKKYGIRILGTHSIGYVLPHIKLNASFLSKEPEMGNIAFISQSGALCNAILDWSAKEKIGFSAFISLGTMLDVEWADVIAYIAEDYRTKAILLYMESVGEARKFITAAREVAFSKPIIAVKAGRVPDALSVAAFHSGMLPGDNAVINAAFRRSGILRVERIAELFFMASVLSKQPVTKGNKLAIVTNAGGPAILATDILIEGNGALAELSSETIAKIKEFPSSRQWNLINPLDVQYHATADDIAKVTQLLMRDRGNDGILVIISPQLHCSAIEVAERLIKLAKSNRKPLIVSLLGGDGYEEAHNMLNNAGVPSMLFPDAAVRMFNYMREYASRIKGLYETPSLPEVFVKNRPDPSKINDYLTEIQEQGRTLLSEWESGRVMLAYGLPLVETALAYSADEAIEKATAIGFPVVLKLHSMVTNRKRDLGGLKLFLENSQQVKDAFIEIKTNAVQARGEKVFEGVLVEKMHQYRGIDMVIGSKIDEQFGPVIYISNGGRIVELYEDEVVGLPPLNTTLAHRMMEQTHIYHATKRHYDITEQQFDRIEQFMVRFSHLIAEQPLIKRVSIDPVAVSRDELLILDVEIELHPQSLEEVPKLAIRPYPYEYEEEWVLKNGKKVFIRPIRPDDEPLVVDFHKTLSDQSVYFRYFYSPSFDFRVSHERLAKICFVDYDIEMAIVAVCEFEGKTRLLAAGRTIRLRNTNTAEFALTVSDDTQGTGLGTKLLEYLIRLAKKEGVTKLVADVLPENKAMLYVCKKLGFSNMFDREERVEKVWLELN